MRTIFSIIVTILILGFNVFSQTNVVTFNGDNPKPSLSIKDNGIRGVSLTYEFSGFYSSVKNEGNQVFQQISIPGFNYIQDVGKPALPMHNNIIAVPMNASAEIIINSIKTVEYNNYYIYPALKPEYDYVGAENAKFEIDEEFYQQDKFYPESPVRIIDTLIYRGVNMLLIQIVPIQFNPVSKKIRVIENIEYQVNFIGGSKFINPKEHSENALNLLKNYVINTKGIDADINSANIGTRGLFGPSKDYILITQDNYLEAADSLAQWKRQLGYSVEIVSASSWTSADVLSEIHTRYSNWSPKPDYLLILGDHEDVPGQLLNTNGSTFASDLYYVCMDGGGDYIPDMAKGRISASSASEAMDIVRKIIKYEKTPNSSTAFYNKGINCAYFQESSTSGYAERRFAQTAEEIYQYMTSSIGFNMERAYYTGSSVTPTNWNNGSYSAGEPIPSYLEKPGFAWDGNATDISTSINNGDLFVFHRDHGYEDGWGDPAYDKTDISGLNNGDLLPVVFSINCLTGKFLETECFSEAFLRKPSGGAVGVFCHAEISYSGYNDGLALGLIDAIWANPGLVANFTGTGNNTGTLSPHSSIYTMGDVANQGLIRMTETWGDGWGYEQYTHELFHYFGDPAMRIWTDVPTQITATHETIIDCQDTTLEVYSCSCSDALATLVVDGQLISTVQLSGGTGTFHFSSIAGTQAYITISKHNYQPYIDTIPITGGCPAADFTINVIKGCGENNLFEFTDQSTGNIATITWDFGIGASPATATGIGPHQVTYSTYGLKDITLVVDGSSGDDSLIQTINVEEYCPFNMAGTQTLNECVGALYDDGGPSGNYSDNVDLITTISPTGATQITLDFVEFDVEAGSGSSCDYDYIEIFDGPSTSSTSLGQFCNTNGSPGFITSSSGSITILQHTDGGVNKAGFKAIFECIYPNQPPVTDFSTPDTSNCTGIVNFTDESSNGPDSWDWDFGDGQTSTNQNPVHVYTSSGIYNVTLIAANSYGSDTLTKLAYINIAMPSAPITVNDTVCNSGIANLQASGSGILEWYNTNIGGALVNTGNTFTTPNIISTTTYYVEDHQISYGISQYVGSTDNNINGNIYDSDQYLVFDAFAPFKLISVEVNAQGAGNRTVELRDNGGTSIASTTINIPDGINRITLDFDVPAGNDYQLGVSSSTANINMFRNNSGVSYPYEIAGLVSIKHSSASSNPTGYYYFYYDWEIQEKTECISPREPVTAYVESPETVDINISASSTSICSGDNVTFTATPVNGGTSPVYDWMINGSSVGTSSTYSTTSLNDGDIVTCELTSSLACNNGPTTSNSITISVVSGVPADVTISSNVGTTICDGEQVIFDVIPINGGTPSYEWFINGSSVGTNASYTSSTIADNDIVYCIMTSSLSCVTNNPATSNTITMTVIQDVTPTILISTTDTSICPNDNVTFTSTVTDEGSTPIYNWEINGISTGITTVGFTTNTLSDNDQITCELTSSLTCTTVNPVNSNTITITVEALPIADFNFSTNQLEATFTNSSANTTSYLWNFGDGSSSTNQNPTYMYSTAGTYSVTLIATNNCGSDTITYDVSVIETDIKNNSLLSDIEIYPVPTKDKVTINLNNNVIDKFEIFDVIGKIQYTNNNPENEQTLNLEKYSKGMYLIKFYSKKGTLSRKLIITK